MRFFKYLIFVFFTLTSNFSFAIDYVIQAGGAKTFYSLKSACQGHVDFQQKRFPNSKYSLNSYSLVAGTTNVFECSIKVCYSTLDCENLTFTGTYSKSNCPSAIQKDLSVPINSGSYVCVQQCQYALQGCVNVQFDSGGNPDGGDASKMTCSAISTGKECTGSTNGSTGNTSSPTGTGDPGSNGSNDGSSTATNSATSTSTGSSTSTSTSNTTTTTTNNTTNNTSSSTSTTTTSTTTTNNNTTNTTIDLSSLENTIVNTSKQIIDAINKVGDKISEGDDSGTDMTETNKKLDDIKKGIDDGNEWGKEGANGDLPVGESLALPEKTLEKKTFSENLFASSAQCPANKTLSMSLLGARSFSYNFDFTQWCYYLGLLGQMILIGAYLHGANIITRS